MKRSKAQYARLIELNRRIREGRFPNCLTFAEAWEVSQKTVQRDIDFLRDQCGAPLAYDRCRKGFYYEDPTWVLPSVLLTEGELFALMLGARAMEQYAGTPVAKDLQHIFRKLAENLPDTLSIRPESLFSDFTFRGPPTRPITPDVWASVVRSVQDRKTLAVRYRPFHATRSKVDKQSLINPYHLANLEGEWYILGVHAGHTDVRQFALARVEHAELTDKSFTVPAGFDPDALLAPVFGRFAGEGEVHQVRLRFDREIADWMTERQWHPRQTLKRLKTGDIELGFPAKGLFEVQRWVLSWGHYVTVLAPEPLRRSVEDEVRASYRRQK